MAKMYLDSPAPRAFHFLYFCPFDYAQGHQWLSNGSLPVAEAWRTYTGKWQRLRLLPKNLVGSNISAVPLSFARPCSGAP